MPTSTSVAPVRRPTTPDLERLVAAARDGDQRAWAEIVNRYTGVIRAAARSYQLAAHDAEDVAQNTWIQLLDHLDRLREPGALPAWLQVTARRECLRVKTRSLRELPLEPSELPEESEHPEPLARLLADERRAAIRRALADLTPRQRAVMGLLVRDSDLGYAAIAAKLGMPIGSIGPTRARCLEQLRRHGALGSLAA